MLPLRKEQLLQGFQLSVELLVVFFSFVFIGFPGRGALGIPIGEVDIFIGPDRYCCHFTSVIEFSSVLDKRLNYRSPIPSPSSPVFGGVEFTRAFLLRKNIPVRINPATATTQKKANPPQARLIEVQALQWLWG